MLNGKHESQSCCLVIVLMVEHWHLLDSITSLIYFKLLSFFPKSMDNEVYDAFQACKMTAFTTHL